MTKSVYNLDNESANNNVNLDGNTLDNKNKHEIRIEKHSRLMKYFEDKRLREELRFIDEW